MKKQCTKVIVVSYSNARTIKDSLDGIKKELNRYDLEDVKISYITGKKDTFNYLIKKVKKNDILVTVGEMAAINLKNIKCQKVVTNIVDPISMKITDKLQNQDYNITGVTDKVPLNLYIDLMCRIKRNVKLISVVYFKNSKNSQVQIETINNICKTRGIGLRLIGLTSKLDIKKVKSKNKEKIDMIFIPIDDQANHYVKDISKNMCKGRIPIIVSDKYALKDGAFASIGISYYSLGRQTGQYILRLLNGEKAKDIYFETEKKVIYDYNKSVIEKLQPNFKE
jgi:putative ABC transport system substrate-binding protein